MLYGRVIMKNEFYMYKGSLLKSKDVGFFENFIEQNQDEYIVKDKIKDLISDDEKLELVVRIVPILNKPLGVHAIFTCLPFFPPILIPGLGYNIYINLKASTLAIIALILDIKVTNGISSFILAATGVNIRSIAKIDENIGEKCVLLEVYRKEDHQANPDIFKQVCGKECINNDMNCKYRSNGVCTMDQERVKGILDNLSDKNVLTKRNDSYKYNF